MHKISIIKHFSGSPGLRLLGLGPKLIPCNGMMELQKLLSNNTFWAVNRNQQQLRKMLANSSAAVSLWKEKEMVGFGRATSDKIYRAVLWDIVIADHFQGIGLGSVMVNALLENRSVKGVEKVYLMTTRSSDFYEQMNFKIEDKQTLLIKKMGI